MDLAAGGVRGPAVEMYRPTVMVGEDQLVISVTPAAAEHALTAGLELTRTGGRRARFSMTRRLPTNLIFLSVSDPRDSMPTLIEKVPTLIQQANAAIGQAQRQAGKPGGGVSLQVDPDKVPRAAELRRLLFPAFSAWAGRRWPRSELRGPRADPQHQLAGHQRRRDRIVASCRPVRPRGGPTCAQCVNNLKQLGLAFHNYLSANNAFPKAAITDKQGKPLLSWRVAILPYIDQRDLYNKFKLDKPWDSPHNKAS